MTFDEALSLARANAEMNPFLLALAEELDRLRTIVAAEVRLDREPACCSLDPSEQFTMVVDLGPEECCNLAPAFDQPKPEAPVESEGDKLMRFFKE